MKKKILVLMSTYNGENYIEEQLKTILSQKGDFCLDILVRDDGSTDLTCDILSHYQKKGLLKWYTGDNLKPAKSFMDLVFKCDNVYDYYAFSDQDDFWMENKIQAAINLLENEKTAVYYSNPELVDKDLNSLGNYVYKNIPNDDLYTTICGASIIGCTMVFTHELMKIIKQGEMPKYITMHDSYIARICVAVGGKIIYDNNSYMKYRQHGNNVLGIGNKFGEKLKNRLHDIFNESPVTIDKQTNEILRIYEDKIPSQNKIWLEKVINYRKNIINRISLACCRKTKYITSSISIKIRLAILFGNR